MNLGLKFRVVFEKKRLLFGEGSYKELKESRVRFKVILDFYYRCRKKNKLMVVFFKRGMN